MNSPNSISSALQNDFATQIFNQSPDKILVIGQNYTLQYFNPSAQQFSFLFGLKKLEVGMTLLPTIEINYWKNVFDEGLAGKSLEFKKYYIKGDEKYSDLINVYPIKNEKGEVSSLVFQAKKLDRQSYVPKDILENKALFRTLFETSPVGITIRKLKTQKLLTYNQKICEMFGCTYYQFPQLNRSDFIHKEDIETISEKTQLLLEEKIESFQIEKQYKKQNGEIFWGLATRSSFKIGNEIYQIGILEDISTQKRIKEELIRNEAKIKSIFNSTKDKIFAVNKDLKLIDANSSALKTLGYFNLDGKTKNLSLNDFDFNKITAWKPHLLRAFAGEEYNFEGKYNFEGIDRIDLITVSPLKNKTGEIIGATIYGKEITELIKIKNALAENEARLLEAEKLAKIGYWEIDVANQMTYWSEGTPRILNLSAQTTHMNLEEYYELVHPDYREDLKQALENTIKHNIPYEFKSKKITPTGKVIYTIGRGEPLVENGKVIKIFGTIQDITKESEIENALIESEAKVRTILNSTKDKIFAVDNQYRLLDFNESAAKNLPKLFGMEKLEIGEEMLSKNQETRMLWIDHYNIALTGKRLIVEKKYREKGEWKTDIVTLSPIKNNNNETIGVTVYGKDVTDLQKTQQAFQETQIQLEDAQKLGKIGTWKYDASIQKIIWSASTLRFFDVEEGQPMPSFKECLQHVHKEDVAHVTKAVYNAVKKKKDYDHVARVYTLKNRLIYTHTKGKATYDKNGKLLSFEGTIQDITELKEIEENIQTTTEQYRDLFENVNDAIVITNQEGRMIDCNQAMVKLLGYTREELGQLEIKDIVHPDDQERSKKFLQMLIDQGFYENYQGRIFHKDGSVIHIQVSSSAIYDDDGNLVGSRDIVRDISELKKVEQKREQLLAELAEVNKELKDFAYIVSHDLKAPLRAIKAISHWLSEDYANQLDEEGQQQLQLLSNRVNRMHQFINGIFEYTKLGRIKESKEIVDLNKMIQEAPLMLNLPKNVELNILNTLPDVYGEKVKIEQVFHNIISNAVKYNDKPICKIEIDFEDQDTHYLFRIKDNGKGIEEKNYEKVFQIFQTLQPKDEFESTGIGLSIVKRIVQLHGGEISVKSDLGKSTTFEFSLKK